MGACALVGAVDFNSADFQRRYDAGEFDAVIAVDAGLAHLEGVGVIPDIALGDFDSLGYVPENDQRGFRVMVYPAKKDKSDMELAMDLALSKGYDQLVVYGALSGRLDHTVANLQLFACFSERGVCVTGVGMDFAVRLITGPGSFSLPEGIGRGTVSVFSAGDEACGVVERGLEYPLDGATLTNRTSWGLSNELVGKPASVSVKKGTLYVFHPVA